MFKATILALVLALGACVTDDESSEQELQTSIYTKCGKRPGPEPGWAVVPGTYPGQGPNVCLPTQQYIDRDRYLQDARDWTTCIQIEACRLYGDCE